MHIKRFSKEPYLDPHEVILYAVKMYLLYRLIIFELLGIDREKYHNNLDTCIASWNQWSGILDQFLQKIQ